MNEPLAIIKADIAVVVCAAVAGSMPIPAVLTPCRASLSGTFIHDLDKGKKALVPRKSKCPTIFSIL